MEKPLRHCRTPVRVALQCLAVTAFAQVATSEVVTAQAVRGQVIDAENQQPVPSARVAVRNHADSLLTEVVTGPAGEFALLGLPEGRLALEVSALGYTALSETTIDHYGKSMFLAIELRPAPLESAGIVVTVEAQDPFLRDRGYYSRERIGHGRFLDEEQLDQMVMVRSSDMFRRLASVTVVNEEPVISRGPVGFAPCRPAIYQDGMLVRSEKSDASFNDVVVPPVWIQAVEVYPGPASAPPQWRGSAACGLIVIWTRH